jgi:gamma-glutamyltranspeptidase / glutathione hydrolase
MRRHFLRTHFRTTLVLAVAAIVFAPLGSAASPSNSPYSLQSQALLGAESTDLYLTVSGPIAPDRIEKLQVKALPFQGEELQTTNYFDLAVVDGMALLHLPVLDRHRPLHLLAHVKGDEQNNVEDETTVMLRPDLAVTHVTAPADVVRRQPFSVGAAIAEVGGDTGASATATLFDGDVALTSQTVSVQAGSVTTAQFDTSLPTAGSHQLRVAVSGSSPAEAYLDNNAATATVDVHMYTNDGAVSTDHRLATAVGEDILREGGTAVDAAAAVFFALNVVDPNVAGIGGGSNVLVRFANGETYAIDGRELAPAATTSDTYTKAALLFGAPAPAFVGRNGYSVGVPTALLTVDAMLHRGGTMSLAQVIQPAIGLAENGFDLGQFMTGSDGTGGGRFADLQPETIAAFGGLKAGDKLVQPDLAKTLRLIAENGVDAFYGGPVAQAIVDAQHRLAAKPAQQIVGGSGQMTLTDLQNAHVALQQPLSLDYHGAQVLAPPPSTSGGLILLETLGVYQKVQQANPSATFEWGSFNAMHSQLESMRLAFADRDLWTGDPGVVPVPTTCLLSDAYLASRATQIAIDGTRIRDFGALPGDPCSVSAASSGDASVADEDTPTTGHTTHFSIIDKWGNAVAFTTTLADSFGSGIMVPGYGFVLNDSLNLFNMTPKGDGHGSNDAGPNKRPMGSMTPTIVVKDGDPLLVTGTYGGMYIPSLVLNTVLNVVDNGMTLQQAVDAPRMWATAANAKRGNANFARNDGFPQATIDRMLLVGDQIAKKTTPGFGSASSAGIDLANLTLVAASDKRQFADQGAVVIPR